MLTDPESEIPEADNTTVRTIATATAAQNKWRRDNSLCKLLILNSMKDTLAESYIKKEHAKDIWEFTGNQVKGCSLPQLPRHRELISELLPIHARLTCESSTAQRHPVHKCSEVQAEAAREFLNVIKCYMESFCSNLRAHTITNVQSNNDKVSLLLKDSFLDSFPSTERPFMKLLIDTQLFSALSDSRLSTYEHE